MKYLKKLTLLCFIIAVQNIWTQQNSFNYKAIIKDNLGNVVANQTINVQLQIIQGGIPVYLETHTPTTDANGLVVLSIGNGTTSDDFSSINWSAQNHNLNVQIDIGSGLVNLGAFQFKTVPYSKFALNADNVNGLETIDEGNGLGWRLVDRNPLKYGNIGFNATDVSFSNLDSDTKGATGNSSFATNSNTTASGNKSFAAGGETTASGDTSFAAGVTTIASGARSTAFGSVTTASGIASSAFGSETKAESVNSFALGMFNIGGGDPQSLNDADPLFEIGNGTNDTNRSNALTVLKNGTITAPSFDISEITDAKALITKEYLEANTGGTATGLEILDEGNGQGWRLIGQNPDNYANIGSAAVDLSGTNNASDGNSGAAGDFAFSAGLNTKASGFVSMSSGISTQALGNYTNAFGAFTKAEATISAAFGRYNVGGGNLTTWNPTDPLFEIGNGSADNDRSNALTVYKNGVVNINDSYNLPTDDGLAGQVLTAVGDGTTIWFPITNDNSTGLEAINEGNGLGWRLKDKNPANYGNIGANSVDLSQSNSSSSTKGATGLNALATGFNTTASGNYSTAMGFNSNASNIYATAIGNEASATADNAIALGRLTTASGGSAVALGSQTTASNIGATAMGSATVASGRSATATGRFTRAQAFSGVAIGRYNTGNGNSGDWVNTDPLFEVGNGSADNDRSNALTVYKNGAVNINDAYNLPQSDGTAGQVLTTLGNGNTQWTAVDASVPTLVDVVNYGTDYSSFGLDLEEPRFYIDKNKVQIEGYMRKDFGTGDINIDDVLFVLPIGYRPLNKHMFLCPQISGRNLLVSVNPDGSVIAEDDSNSQFIALNSISFRID